MLFQVDRDCRKRVRHCRAESLKGDIILDVLSRNLPTSSMVMNEAESGPLCSWRPPSQAHSSIEETWRYMLMSNSIACKGTRNGTDQVLELPRPQPIVLVKRVLVGDSLQASNLLLLSQNLDGSRIENGLHCFDG